MLGTSFAPVALAFGILELPGATATTLSVVLTAEALPMVRVHAVRRGDRGPVAAAAGDDGRRVVNALAFFALAAMMLAAGPRCPAWRRRRPAAGSAMAVLYPALTGIIPEVVPADRLQTGNALLGLGANVSRVAGRGAGRRRGGAVRRRLGAGGERRDVRRGGGADRGAAAHAR